MAHPRRSFIDLLLYKALRWQAAILFVVGLAVLGFAASASLRAMRLETRAATVSGSVVEMKITTRKCGKHHTRTCHTYKVTYAYRLPDGRGTRLTESVSKGFYDRQRSKGDVLVHYLPDDLSVAEIDWGASRRTSWWLELIGAGLVLAGGSLLLPRARRVRQLVWLAQHGTPVSVTVDRHEKGPMFQSGKRDLCAMWFGQVGGAGRTDARRPDDLPQPGATIRVLADPRGKFAPVWEEDLL